ncbi:hypothetical protein M9458_029509, partial [Cirrhinus mrigala]
MDPSSVDPSLQKTSPSIDPAAVHRLTTEVSAQASVLATHQQQLAHLTALTEEMVKTLRSLQLPSAETAPLPVATPSPSTSPAAPVASPRLAYPDKFDGSPAKCKGFLLQCSLFVTQQPALYPTEESRIAFVCSLLTGKALDWATAVWDLNRPSFPSFKEFLRRFKEVFDYPEGGEGAGEQILMLRQGKNTAAEFALTFRTLAAQTGWPDEPLKLHFRKGLSHELQAELACRDEGKSLDELINLAIRIDNLIRSRRIGKNLPPSVPPSTSTPEPEAMQTAHTRLTAEERERRHQLNLCLYCANQVIPSQRTSTATVKTPVTITLADKQISTIALIDSGAAGNFMDLDFAKAHDLTLKPCSSLLTPPAASNSPLAFFTLRPSASTSSKLPVTQDHTMCFPTLNPKIFDVASVIVDSPIADNIPSVYHDLAEAFSKSRATQLPPHRTSDCAIELLPGTTPPKGRIFPLSQPETEAMKTYIEEELAKGFIVPSTSPDSAGFFFVKNKDGSLRPCIDFRGLNDITVKYRYPLPLVPSALEQLRSAKYFTKLDLRNAYNLIRIREGDEWKTAFSTTTGHYEYRVMPFGLVNSPSVFQSFINDVFRDMLGRWVIIYMDDILIYSDSLNTSALNLSSSVRQDKLHIPQALRERVLQLVHCNPSSDHPGITATLQLLSNKFWWPTLRSDTVNYIRNCETCCIIKPSKQLPAGLLQPLPIPQRPWSHIAIDFVTDLPPSAGHTTILTVIDRFSKSCRLIPLPKLPTALETAETLCNYVFRFYGLPDDIVSDRGPQFTSRLWSAFFKCLNVNISLTSGYHPESNGQSERLNQEIIRFLRSYCHRNQADWSKFLFWAEYAQNSIRKPATGLTPFQCVLGFQPPLFPWSGDPSDLPTVNTWMQRSEATWNAAHTHLQVAIRRQKRFADLHRRPGLEFAPGSWVWLSTRDLRLRLPCRKLSPRYVGPFKVIRQVTPVSYRLALPSEYRISPTFHVSLLKAAGAPRGADDLDEVREQGPPPLIIDDEEAYRVNKILNSRRRGGVLQYLVDWEGYGPEERSWVNAKDILDPSLTAEFHQNHPDKPAPRPRGRPRRQQPPHIRSRSQGGGSVTIPTSVVPPDRHQ